MNDLLIWQYRQKPKAKATINAITQESDGVFKSAYALGDLLNVDTARGFALDLVGKHVGVSRLVKQYIKNSFFGFADDEYAKGFERGEWYLYGEQIRDDTLLGDDDFRFIIKARIMKNYQTGTLDNLTRSIQYLFGQHVSVIDNLDMTINATIPSNGVNEFKTFAVKNLDVLARPVGVRLRFFKVEAGSFGWHEDDQALGFNAGTWSDFI